MERIDAAEGACLLHRGDDFGAHDDVAVREVADVEVVVGAGGPADRGDGDRPAAGRRSGWPLLQVGGCDDACPGAGEFVWRGGSGNYSGFDGIGGGLAGGG